MASEAWTARVSQRISRHGHSRRLLLTHPLHPVSFNGENIHQKYDYIEMVRQITGIDDDSFPKIETISSQARRPEIAIFPGAEYGPAKRWIEDRFVQTALLLQKKTNAQICFYGAEKDQGICEEMTSQVPGSRSEAGKTRVSSSRG